jgi:hypothetical protein
VTAPEARVAWVSRHRPSARLVAEVQARWPGARLVDAGGAFRDAGEILARVRRAGAARAIVVAPLAVLAALCSARDAGRGVELLWAEAEELDAPAGAEWTMRRADGRTQHYRHARLRRVVRVAVDLEDL